MAHKFDDLEFWLPSEFLTDDDLLTDFKTDCFKSKELDDYSYGFGNSFGFNSDLSSPTTETESDDDDVISELTRKMAHSSLHHSSFSDYSAKGLKLSGSPQSTLCGFKPGSRGSPNSASGVSSPQEAEEQRRWDLLYAAAGEVARMRMIDETVPFYSSKLYTTHAKPSPVAAPPQGPNPASSFYPNHHSQTKQNHLSYQMLQAAKFQQMKQHQMLKERVTDFQLQGGRRNGGDVRAHCLPPSAWPALQQPGSGMTAVFLGEPAPKKERTGTGVFLPQRFGSVPSETRRKQAGSTVLLPERVIHALNFNRDAIDAQVQQRNNGRFITEYEAAMKQSNDLAMAQQQRRSLASQPVMNHHHHQQLRLPQEWTY